jgi:hypothetical protein
MDVYIASLLGQQNSHRFEVRSHNTYIALPSFFRVVKLWRENLGKINAKSAQSLADPAEYENLFPGLKDSCRTEQYVKAQRAKKLPARSYPNVPVSSFTLSVLYDIT